MNNIKKERLINLIIEILLGIVGYIFIIYLLGFKICVGIFFINMSINYTIMRNIKENKNIDKAGGKING